MENENSKNIETTVYYNGASISHFILPPSLSKFKLDFISKFGLTKQLTSNDITSIKYNEESMNTDSDYNGKLNNNAKAKNSIIYVETEKVPIHFEGEKSIEFEEEIKKLVENELRVAACHIKNGLTNNLSLSNCKKIRNEKCNSCKKQIIGYLYQKISPEKEKEYFCELCAIDQTQPMFKIH